MGTKNKRIANRIVRNDATSVKRKGGNVRIADRISSERTVAAVVTESPEAAVLVTEPAIFTNSYANRTSRATTRNQTLIVQNVSGTRHHSYEDRHHYARNLQSYAHVFRDTRSRLCHRMIWPRYSFNISYQWGRSTSYRRVYPYYHRRYAFVSLNGCWPSGYNYVRYHWYPSHSYDWYGYHPIARQLGNTYNYYTYNYYNDGATVTGYSSDDGTVNHETFADIREKLAAEDSTEPEPEKLADTIFAEAVTNFENAEYAIAAEKFATTMELAPEDNIVPFAFIQALFADDKYLDSAVVLRAVLEHTSPEKDGIFYPRGLYLEEETLLAQIDKLASQARHFDFTPDKHLLLGYQLLGIGEMDKAIEHLTKAAQNPENSKAVTVLLELTDQIKANGTN